ncbi:MAG: hypothetical protein VB122_08620 [Erysipelotrichales bacterium]|nr:hypothetical protein [Erysipelotrichales bacterium]
MVGSDFRRITQSKQIIFSSSYGLFIGSVIVDGQIINFSPRFNSIIGVRGTGKSILFDIIANKLDSSTNTIEQGRKECVKQFKVSIKDFGGLDIQSGFQYGLF